MGVHIQPARGFGSVADDEEVWFDPSTWADDSDEDTSSDSTEGEAFGEGMFNTIEDEFYTYEGDPIDADGNPIGSSLIGVPAVATNYYLATYEEDQPPIVIGSTLGGSGLDGSDASISAAYAYGYERGQGDKIAGNPADPTAAVDNVLMGAPSSAYGVLTTAAKQGYADGYAGAADQTKDPAKVDPKKKTVPGGTTEAQAAGMSTGTMVAIGLGVGAAVVLGVMVAKKKKGR